MSKKKGKRKGRVGKKRGRKPRRESFRSGVAGPRPTISACLIVRDEERLLPRCLASIANIADEIVLVDTGSKDGTVEIAKGHGCRVFHFPWNGDFSAARNESLRHATGEWILIVDADEEVPRDEREKILGLARRRDIEIIAVSVYNRCLETGLVSSFLPSVRMFRRRLDLRYQGIVHNRLMLPASVPVTRSPVRLYHYGYDLSPEKLQRKKARSRELLEEQLRQNPDDVFANFNMAQLLQGMEGTRDAETSRRILDHARRVLDHPDSTKPEYFSYRLMALYHMATSLCALARYEEAETYCQLALALKPDYIDAALVLANLYLAAGNLAAAGEGYRKYLDLLDRYRPENETDDIIVHTLDDRHVAWYGQAAAAKLEGNGDEAVACWQRVLDARAPYLDTYLQMGAHYLETGAYTDAEEMFAREISVSPGSALAYLGLGRALDRQGMPDKSLSYLEKAADLAPDNARIDIYLGKTLIRLGRIESGMSRIEAAAAKAGDDAGLLCAAGDVFLAAGEIRRAAGLYERAVLLRPEMVEALTNLGNCHFKMEKYEKACARYEQALEIKADFAVARRNLGLAYAHLGYQMQALTALMAYAEQCPDDVDIFGVIGDLFSMIHRYEEAIGCYENYLPHHPENHTCLLNLAEAYFHLGHTASAAAGYRKVLAADPACRLAAERLESMGRATPTG